MSKQQIPCSDLPKELLEKIGKRLDTETDFRRFRGVCNSWRSSTTTFRRFPLTPIHLPFPFAPTSTPDSRHHGAYFNLVERTVYLLQNPEIEHNNSWIVKTETLENGKLRILNPVSNHQIKVLPETLLPKVLNTLDFRVFEICKAYALQYANPSKNDKHVHYELSYAKKVAVSSSFDTDDFVVMAIDENDKLWYIKSGDLIWTLAGRDYDSNFSDVVNYKGKFYGISVGGNAWVFDSSFEPRKMTCYICHPAAKRHLVDLHDGELCLVEEVTDENKRVCTCYEIEDGCYCSFPRTPIKRTNVEIIISRIDKGAREWVEVKKVDHRMIFVGDDCSFSVSPQQIKGFKGTRVFYADQYIYFRTEEDKKPCEHASYCDCDCYANDDDYYDYSYCDCGGLSDDETSRVDSFVPNDDVKAKFRGMHGHNTGVCDFETGTLGSLLRFPEYASIFWPPPSWLNRV